MPSSKGARLKRASTTQRGRFLSASSARKGNARAADTRTQPEAESKAPPTADVDLSDVLRRLKVRQVALRNARLSDPSRDFRI